MELTISKEFKNGEITFRNAKLAKETKTLATNMNKSKEAFCKAAAALRRIQQEKLFEDDYFDPETNKPSFSAYCECVLGISKSAAYRIMNTAEHLLVPELQMDENDAFFRNFGDTALTIIDEAVEGYEDAKQFCERFDICETTPQKDIRAAAKQYKADKKGETAGAETGEGDGNNTDVVAKKTTEKELKSLVGQFFRTHLNALIEVDGEFANLVKEVAERW